MKRLFLLTILATALGLAAAPTSVKVSKFGFDPADATRFLQQALNSGAARVIVDNVGKPWITNNLKFRSNQEVIFENGVVVEALPGAFQQIGTPLFELDKVKNVTLRGEGKVIVRMRKEDYQNPKLYKWSEWRHLLSIAQSENITVRNLTLKSSGGDGIYIRSASQNIVIDKVICDDHYRQGMSIISVDGLKITNSKFMNTSGTPPTAGLDIEPNKLTDVLRNIVIENCDFIGNKHSAGFIMSSSLVNPCSVTVRNCRMLNNRHGIHITENYRADAKTVGGTLLFENCHIAGNYGRALSLAGQRPQGHKITLRNLLIDARSTQDDDAIYFDNSSMPANFCNVRFEKVKVIPGKKQVLGFTARYGYGMTGVTGDITVIGEDKKEKRFDLTFFRKRHAPKKEIGTFKAADFVPRALKQKSTPAKGKKSDFIVRGRVKYAFCADKPGVYPIHFRITRFWQRRYNSRLTIYDKTGNIMGSYASEKPEFTYNLNVRSPGVYVFDISTGLHGMYINTDLSGGIIAQDPAHFIKGSRLYFYVPAGTKEFEIEIAATPSEYVTAEILDPAGKKVMSVEKLKTTRPFRIKPAPGTTGAVWQLHVKYAVEDHYIRLSAPLIPILAPTPDKVLIKK